MEPLPGCSLIGRPPGSAPGVVLLHSSMSTRGQWKKLAVELARDHSVLSVDLFGYGESPLPPFPAQFSLAEEAGRVLDLASHYFRPGTPFLLVGHSYGGAVALQLARDHPRRVAGTVVYEPVCFNLLDDDADRNAVRNLAEGVRVHAAAGRQRDAARLFFDFWNGAGAFDALPESLQQKFAGVAAKVALDFRALRFAPRAPLDYGCIEAPTLILGGTRSPRITRRIVERLGAAIPSAAVGWIEGDHMTPATAPERVNPQFARFLRAAARTPVLLAA